jgi:hypothetical protein
MSTRVGGVNVDQLVEEAVERLRRFEDRDAEFERRFGKWTRPSFARRYDLQRLVNLHVRWLPEIEGILDVKPLLMQLAPEDRRIAAEIARFVSEEYEGKFATDKTLKTFRLDLARRLDACGF